MTNNVMIHAEGLGKLYHIGKLRQTYSLRASLNDSFARSMRYVATRFKPKTSNEDGQTESERNRAFWALQNASFDITTGEVLGLIGKNGSGKSTLLKILARITRPTTGFFDAYGRIGALLEVGTGFHPDLTGRENMYLNGSILGMRRSEITSKFDMIVAFSEIEQFIDTPVKYYSSGMYVRLAFAVAAHLDTDILLLDEVLAVGDIGFQRKSLDKMKSVAKDGRTVVIVSQTMDAIKELCDRVILLNGGEIHTIGTPAEVVPVYEKLIYA